MVPLKQGSRGVRLWRCKGRRGGVIWHPHMEYQEDGCTPAIVGSGAVCNQQGGGGGVNVGCYLSLSPVVSCRIWSHTCGSWYLPRFLFNDRSLALMYMASLMCLVVPCVSLWTMLKQSALTGCPVELVWLLMGGEGPEVLLEPFPKSSASLPYMLNYWWLLRIRTLSYKKWSHLPIQMPNHQLSSWVYRRDLQSFWGQTQGTPQSPSPIHHHTSSTGHPVSI